MFKRRSKIINTFFHLHIEHEFNIQPSRNGVQTHSKPRINCEYSMLYLQLFRDFEWVCTPFRGVLHFVTAGYHAKYT
jgi:hypothetical protein